MIDGDLSRRDFLGAAAAVALPRFVPCSSPVSNEYELGAREAIKWIRAQGTLTGAGRAWPSIPGKTASQTPDLYSGTAGVSLLLAVAGSKWKDREMIGEALQGAKEAQSWAPQLFDRRFLGLYTGLAGITFALGKLKSAGVADESWVEDPNLDLPLIYGHDLVKRGTPLETNDVISGLAGIGLSLLDDSLRADRKAVLAVASSIGDELVSRAKSEPSGLRWELSEGYTRNLPNFSHGTAGVAFFLARLYGRTKKKSHLEAAVKGGEYLLGISNRENGGCLIFHADPDGLGRYYLGWCHGPAGTSQLWWQLAKVSGEKKWTEFATRGARSILDQGAPEKRTEGFWNNEGLCCGTAGIGRFFLDAFRRTKERAYLEAAERCARLLLERAVRDEKGLRWLFAENRVSPDQTATQVGWMQGAAGIAAFMLEMSSPAKSVFRLPVDADS